MICDESSCVSGVCAVIIVNTECSEALSGGHVTPGGSEFMDADNVAAAETQTPKAGREINKATGIHSPNSLDAYDFM